MPVKFSLRVAASVDPAQPFVYTEDLTIKIYATSNPGNILQTSVFGTGAQDYRIDTSAEKYVTNFNTSKVPMQYTVEIWRTGKNFLVGSFTFETVVAPTPCHFVGGGTIGTSRDPRVAFGMNVHNNVDLQNILAVVWGRNYFWLIHSLRWNSSMTRPSTPVHLLLALTHYTGGAWAGITAPADTKLNSSSLMPANQAR